MINKEIKVYSPATVANISSGFDVMGLAIEGAGDTLVMRKINKPGAHINLISGAELPMDADKNIASYVSSMMLKKAGVDFGIEIDLYKGIIGGSGLGSSASSCAAAAVGTNYFLDNKLSKEDLIYFASEGEKLACGTPITDNVAPAILGGIVFIQNAKDRRFISLPVPNDLYLVIIHPQIEIKTEDARNVLPKKVPLTIATKQIANFGGLLTSIFTEDWDLMKNSMIDYLAEPYRFKYIQGYQSIRQAAMEAGAIGGGISGSGPSVYHICKGMDSAERIQNAINKTYAKENIPYKMYLSKIDTKGTYIVEG